jgi:four helix bundle protein
MMDFKSLKMWRKAHELVLEIYRITRSFPADENYGITSQLRRAAVSIPNNIAEGCGRESKEELNRFIIIASGSASEVEYLIMLSADLSYIPQTVSHELLGRVTEIKKMLTVYSKKIQDSLSNASKHLKSEI